MITHLKNIIIGCLIASAGCTKTPLFVIRDGAFYVTGEKPQGETARKISSKAELQEFVCQFQYKPVQDHLSSLTNITFNASFIYVTTDAELVEIRSFRGVSVKFAILKKAPQPGIGIYLLEGDPHAPIKPANAENCP